MKKRFTAGVLLAIFTFLFLETEYLFVNIMGTLSNSRQAVSTQGIVLGVSGIGFPCIFVPFNFFLFYMLYFTG